MTTPVPVPADGSPDFAFSHLEIGERITRYKLDLVGPECYVEGRPAMEVNKAYQEGILATSGVRDRLRRTIANAQTQADKNQDREDDFRLFSTCVLTGWGGVVNRAGKPVPFTPANCEAFLRALPSWMFVRLQVHFKMPETFVGEHEAPPVEAGPVVGNS